MKRDYTVSWFSAGCSSAVATKFAIEWFPKVRIVYIHIEDQHPDTLRFVHDCEKWFNQEVEIIQSPLLTVENAIRASGFLGGPMGAGCTNLLKKRTRKEWELKNYPDLGYIWGFDKDEVERSKRLDEMIDGRNIYPLIEEGISKENTHGIILNAGIKRPAMYDEGYPNNNCIGCIKGGKKYWSKIRDDYPDIFLKRCALEETMRRTIFKETSLKNLPVYEEDVPIIVPDCGLFCGEI